MRIVAIGHWMNTLPILGSCAVSFTHLREQVVVVAVAMLQCEIFRLTSLSHSPHTQVRKFRHEIILSQLSYVNLVSRISGTRLAGQEPLLVLLEALLLLLLLLLILGLLVESMLAHGALVGVDSARRCEQVVARSGTVRVG